MEDGLHGLFIEFSQQSSREAAGLQRWKYANTCLIFVCRGLHSALYVSAGSVVNSETIGGKIRKKI